MRRAAFTFVELIVVIGIVALLASIILPSIVAAQRAARATACGNNLRQLATALFSYASESRGKYPPYDPTQTWRHIDVVGRHLRTRDRTAAGEIAGGPLVCPDDAAPARCSYALNTWASSLLHPAFRLPPLRGVRFGPHEGPGSRLILAVESWSYAGSPSAGFTAAATVGHNSERPGERFGGAGGLSAPMLAGRWGLVNTELHYRRHRGEGHRLGATNIAFSDGHVEFLRDDELFHRDTGLSTLRALWSRLDPAINE